MGYGYSDDGSDSFFSSYSSKGNSRPRQTQSSGMHLPTVDWNNAKLVDFEKDFYREDPRVSKRSISEIERYRKEHEMTLRGQDIPKPIFEFNEINLTKEIEVVLHQNGWTTPTPIQAQGLPMALSGRNVVGIARTGSGKTGSFLIPAMVHIRAQPPLRRGDGPIVLVVVPTRELAQQVHGVAEQFCQESRMRCVCCYGGADRNSQVRLLRQCPEIVIATPGRLIDLLESNITNLQRCTYLVMDEADRMLDMGFEPQVRKIVSQIRPDRQTLFWSATWPRAVQRLASDFLGNSYIQVNIGSQDLNANPSIEQNVHLIEDYNKERLLIDIIRKQQPNDRLIVFAETKRKTDSVCRFLRDSGIRAGAMHGDKTQQDREYILNGFKGSSIKVLVATDVASRGLDVDDVKVVINYDFPTQFEDYIHRIGRTGRNGKTGISYTFLSSKSYKYASDLVKVMEKANQNVSDELYDQAGVRKSQRRPHNGQPSQNGFSGACSQEPARSLYDEDRGSSRFQNETRGSSRGQDNWRSDNNSRSNWRSEGPDDGQSKNSRRSPGTSSDNWRSPSDQKPAANKYYRQW